MDTLIHLVTGPFYGAYYNVVGSKVCLISAGIVLAASYLFMYFVKTRFGMIPSLGICTGNPHHLTKKFIAFALDFIYIEG